MCGIAGLLRPEGAPVAEAEMRALASCLAHRGPDDSGVLVDGPLGFAHRRLSILDLSSAGHQPMANEDGSVQVVYNGQLFGFEPTRAWLEGRGHRFRSRTDTEVIVHLYEEKGLDLLDDLDGMFAFALWDAGRRRLLLARDRRRLVQRHHQLPHDLGLAEPHVERLQPVAVGRREVRRPGDQFAGIAQHPRDRAELACALEAVDAVVFFDEDTPRELIAELLPDVLVKGADWSHFIAGREEVEAAGGVVYALPLEPGFSSTNIEAELLKRRP